MRKIAEIRKDLAAKVAEVKAMDANAEGMVKAQEELQALMKELDGAQIVEAAEQKAAEQKFNNIQEQRGQFSLVKFVRELASGKGLTGVEAEVAEMGAEEYRRLGLSQSGAVIPSCALRASTGNNYTTAAEGGNLIEQMAAKYVDTLKEKLVVAGLGATVLTDLVGSLPVITSQQIQAGWGVEGAVAGVTKASYAKVAMTPHRNFVRTAVSKDLLRQTSADVEADLLNKMTEAHANLVEKAAICGTGADGQPTGILNNNAVPVVAMGTNGGAATFDKVVELETVVNSNNGNKGSLAYLGNAKVNGALKTKEKANGTARYILEGGSVNGYKFDWSNLVPSNLTKGTASEKCSALIFGNFNDLYIGQWGGIDIVIDPYTAAATGDVVMTLNAWNDALVAEPKSFAVIKDIIA